MAKNEAKKTLKEAMESLNKTYGKGTVMTFNEKTTGVYDVLSTGSISFDAATGIGGLALGKFYELKGWEGVGKSTICGHLAADAQKKFPNMKVLYVDAEHALDKAYFQKLGVNTEEMIISQPDDGEQGFNVAYDMIETGEISLCILDSDTALKPKSEVEGEIGDNAIGKKARLNSQAYPKLKNLLQKTNTCLLTISQFREKIGVMFGSPVTTSGGHAIKFYADGIIEISKSLAKDGDDVYGNKTKIKFTKNKMSPPFKIAEFDIVFGKGIDRDSELITLANDLEIIKKWGKSIKYKETEITLDDKDDYSKFTDYLNQNLDVKEEILKQIQENLYK